jgi:uncharacterized protein YgiM (DUF1202 family)
MGTTTEVVAKLRNGESVRFFNKESKQFIQFQLNKKASNVCWCMYASKDKNDWRLRCETVSLKDILAYREKLIIQRIKA